MKKKNLIISAVVVLILIALVIVTNSQLLKGTFEFYFYSEPVMTGDTTYLDTNETPYFGMKSYFADSKDKKAPECATTDWICSPWPVECGFAKKIKRNCNTKRTCVGGFQPRQEKKCYHQGMPTKMNRNTVNNCKTMDFVGTRESYEIGGTVSTRFNNTDVPIHEAYVWLTNSRNSKTYLDTITGSGAGSYAFYIGYDDLKQLAGKDVNIHVAPVKKGYGAMKGFLSGYPKTCTSQPLSASQSESYYSYHYKNYDLITDYQTFGETVKTVRIPSLYSAKGKNKILNFNVDLLEDPSSGLQIR